MKRYNPKEIEPKWQAKWEADKIYQASDKQGKPKKYVLEYFPYPSGAAMHVGHVRNYTIGDAVARFARMNGYNVLHPMGWDAFGLPAENYAIKHKISPQEAIKQNTARFKKQLMQMGFSYDWSREINSTDPEYYKWTQWLFLLLFKRGLAYQQDALVNWDPVDKTVLANEQVIDGKAERSGATVEKKALKQWFFKITDYADRLLDGLEDLNWSESIKIMQRNWIGRSNGAEINFPIEKSNDILKVFTTRPDTVFGATFMVLAPEHPLVTSITSEDQKSEIEAYIKQAETRSDIERQSTEREKTGVFTGAYSINPASGNKIPVWIADYVLWGYGTGAIMAVPAHDERDWEFAKKFNLPITRVIKNDDPDEACTAAEGILINSGNFNGLQSSQARDALTKWLVEESKGREMTNYKVRDWLISRQRYWGAPIPIIHCPNDGAVAVPDDQLPVVLPKVKSYEPSGDGRSPLANVPEFVNTICPKCGGPAQRETDTMDGFACSSWYFLRFTDPQNDQAAFSRDKADFWLPVDDYIGGAEHAVMHLLYARFWTKVMFDEGLINFEEPFSTLRNQGMILAPDGSKMSKSKNNTIEPDSLIEKGYGADSIRIMELFIGPWDQVANWSVEGMGGSFRFLQRFWTLVQEFNERKTSGGGESLELRRSINKAIKKVSQDMRELSFNTSIAALMECVNELYHIKAEDNYASKDWEFTLTTFLKLLAPFAPHISEELWQQLRQSYSVHISEWPIHNETYLLQNKLTVVIQVNGKLRGEIEVAVEASEGDVVEAAKVNDRVSGYLQDKKIIKTIYVPGKLVNFVVSNS
ncbi:MAG TPA: leucine--tRNA ligase [Candidatus Saccharimonadales bacterium]|nr:leucine--tRNA ligase [Candidatus Saccharimonadales bacterium]